MGNGPFFSKLGVPRVAAARDKAPKDTTTQSITMHPASFPAVAGHPTMTRAPPFPPTIYVRTSSRSNGSIVSLYQRQTQSSSDASGNATCSLCDVGAALGTPDRIIPQYVYPTNASNFSCADLEDQVAREGGVAESAACNAILGSFSWGFLMSAYCGCPGSEPSYICPFCYVGTYLPESHHLNFVDSPVGNITCEQAATFMEYISNPHYCLDWVDTWEEPCCSEGSSPPTQAPSVPFPPAAPTPPTSASVGARSSARLMAAALGMAIAVPLLS